MNKGTHYFKNVEKLRKEHKKSVIEVAEYLNISPTLYEQYENGTELMPVEYFIKLADLYNISLDYIVGRDFKK